MKTDSPQGVGVWLRWSWYVVPAVFTVVLVWWLLHLLPLQHWLRPWLAFALPAWLCATLGLLAGLAGRYYCFVLAEAAGPWIIVDTTVRPTSFYASAMYAPRGTGYAGYLCGPACVAPGHVYHTWEAANSAVQALHEADANVAAPRALRAYSDKDWQALVNSTAWLRPGQKQLFGILPYYS